MQTVKIEVPYSHNRESIILGLANSGIKCWVEEEVDENIHSGTHYYIYLEIKEPTIEITTEKESKPTVTPYANPLILDGKEDMEKFWEEMQGCKPDSFSRFIDSMLKTVNEELE